MAKRMKSQTNKKKMRYLTKFELNRFAQQQK